MKKTALMTGAVVALALASTTPASAERFEVQDEVGRNSVTFTSEAPLEDIVGTTNQITGYLVFDPEAPEDGAEGRLVVPVATLDTGIPLRDEHLRSAAWLDAEQYPEVSLTIEELEEVREVKSGDGFRTFDVVVVGDFSLRGQPKRIEVPGRVTFLQESERTKALMPGDLLAVRASFDVPLADFGVAGPPDMDVIGTKVGEVVTVDVSFRGSNAAE